MARRMLCLMQHQSGHFAVCPEGYVKRRLLRILKKSKELIPMKKNENSGQKQIYLKALKRKIWVSKELHREYFRGMDACRVRQWVHGRCGCPRHELDSCNMDC